jgi:hypothetical protein
MTLAQVHHRRPATTADRLSVLERRADLHEQRVAPMVDQVAEMYALLNKWRSINWFVVKFLAAVGGALGFVAVVMTIVSNSLRLAGH